MKLTEEQFDEMNMAWWRSGCVGEIWSFIKNYDFPFPDAGWKNWSECPPTEEDADPLGGVVLYSPMEGPRYHNLNNGRIYTDVPTFWIRSPFWKPKQDPLHSLIENADGKTKELIRKAYELGKISCYIITT